MYAADELKSSRAFALTCVGLSGVALASLPDNFKDDREVRVGR